MQIRFQNKLLRTKVEASAIYYALLFLFLVGSLLFSFIYIFNAYNSLIAVEKNDNQILFITHKTRHFIENNTVEIGDYTISENDFVGALKLNNYGLFRHYVYSSNGSVFDLFMGGLIKPGKNDYEETLILGNSSFPLSVSGDTYIEGKIKVPERGVKKTFVSSGKRDGSPEIKASVNKVDEDIPDLDLSSFDLNTLYKDVDIFSEEVENSFCTETKVLKVESNKVNTFKSIKGNIIMTSEDSLFLSASLELENVIIQAPVIYVEKGARISGQFIATKKIVLEDDVEMQYPSAIMLKYEQIDTDFESLIEIGKNTSISGAIVLHSKVDKKSILIGEGSKVNGIIYSNRYLELKDDVEIVGQVISAKLYRKTASSEYDNLLLNVKIRESAEEFHKGFLSFKKNDKSDHKWEVLLEDKIIEEKSTDTPYWKH